MKIAFYWKLDQFVALKGKCIFPISKAYNTKIFDDGEEFMLDTPSAMLNTPCLTSATTHVVFVKDQGGAWGTPPHPYT